MVTTPRVNLDPSEGSAAASTMSRVSSAFGVNAHSCVGTGLSLTYIARSSMNDWRPSRTRGDPMDAGLARITDVAVTTVYSSSRSNSRVTCSKMETIGGDGWVSDLVGSRWKRRGTIGSD